MQPNFLVDCDTSYHLDYYVMGDIRFYYDTIPDVLQIGDHRFAERSLINSWRTGMNLAWVSAANCAAIYLHTHSVKEGSHIPKSWPFQPKLLEDHHRRSSVLSVPHGGDQSSRFKVAMQERNNRIRLYGQDELRHHCEKCVRVYNGEDRNRKHVL